VKEILLMQKHIVTGNIRSQKFLGLKSLDGFCWRWIIFSGQLAAGKNEFCCRDICAQTWLERNFWTTIRHQIRHQSASPPSSPFLRLLEPRCTSAICKHIIFCEKSFYTLFITEYYVVAERGFV
jgi:hypothetical protein